MKKERRSFFFCAKPARITSYANYIYLYITISSSNHFVSGLIAMILTFISLVGGVINLYTEKTVITNILHSCAGSLTLVSAFICLCLGFDKTIFRLARGQTTSNLLIALTVFALIGTLLTASVSNGKRLLRR